jgi:hypothetical protein
MNPLPRNWRLEDVLEAERAQNFGALVPVAERLIGRLRYPVMAISGPISTGGCGTLAANLVRFQQAITRLETAFRDCVFNQLPFQVYLLRLLEGWPAERGYCFDLLEEFYGPLFERRLIKSLFFLPDWESSIGCRWERERALKHQILVRDFPPQWLSELAPAPQGGLDWVSRSFCSLFLLPVPLSKPSGLATRPLRSWRLFSAQFFY